MRAMDESEQSTTGVRMWFWAVAFVSALVLAGLAAWLKAWFELPFVGFVYLPAMPVALFMVVALGVNPVLRRLGMAIRRSELLVLAAFWILIAGVVDVGLASNWKKVLLAEDSLAANSRANKPPPANVYGKPNTLSFKQASPNELSLSARADFDQARKEIAAFRSASAGEGRQQAIESYRAIDLKDRYQWPDQVTATTSMAEANAPLDALLESMAVEERLLQALVSERVNVSDLWLGNEDAARLQALRLENPDATIHAPVAVAWDDKPISRIFEPLLNSSLFLGLGMLAVFSLLAATARQWTHHERLTHPLAQVPTTLVDVGFTSRAFKIGFMCMAAVWLWQIFAENGLSLPRLPLNSEEFLRVKDVHTAPFLGIEAPSSAKWVYDGYWNTIRVIPFVIAIAFLVATDVGFSVWSGFFLGALVCGWLYKAGIEVDFARQGRLVSGGALFGFALVILYLGRVHYWALLKAAFGASSAASKEDRLGVWGVRGIVVATVALAGLIYSYSGSLLGAVIALLMLWAIVMVVARIVAESGLVCIQMQPELNPMFASLGFAGWFPLQALIVMGYLGSTLIFETRENAAGYAVQSQKLGEDAGHGKARFFVALGLLSFTAGIVAVVVALLSHVAGPTSMGVDTNALQIGKLYPAAFNPNEAKVFTNQMSFAVGIAFVFVVVACRRVWSGFLFHPIGLVVAATWPIYNLWGSLMIGWVLKVIVLRYGGAKVYADLKPFAIGIIAADVAGYGLEFCLRLLSQLNEWGYQEVSHWPS
jgi:hypothetical protein